MQPKTPRSQKLNAPRVSASLRGKLELTSVAAGNSSAAPREPLSRAKHIQNICSHMPLLRKLPTLPCEFIFMKLILPWRRMDRRYGIGWRLANGVAATVLMLGVVIPVWQEFLAVSSYKLSAEALQLVGHTDPTLAKQLSYDAQSSTYQFNKAAMGTNIGSDTVNLKTQLGTASGKGKDKSLYALDVPTDFSKGVTYHDTNSGLSFSLVPQFDAQDGKVVDNHLVFPLGGDNQAIYTLKNNGLKEDIVVPKVTQDTMSFSYSLNLPSTLQAKVIPDSNGAIGIYSADPTLYGNVSYGNSADQATLQKAREAADKTYLVFGLPSPIIKDTAGNQVGSARFDLQGKTLSVVANGLSATRGAVTIDPSVVITSASDFQTGNNEDDNIDFSTAGQITRGGLTGGTLSGGWTAGTSFTTGRQYFGSAYYNGYVYVLGGANGGGVANHYNDVQYASVNSSTGALGAWQYTSDSYSGSTQSGHGFTNGRSDFQAIAYDGYLYVMGGYDGTTTYHDVQYAPINSNGTVGTWQTTTSLPGAMSVSYDYAATVYNGYIYVMGNSSFGSASYYAPIHADGTLGTWNSTSSLNTGVANAAAIAYNGFMYALGGSASGCCGPIAQSIVQYASINSDGTLGTWSTASSLTAAVIAPMAAVQNGYVYVSGGANGTGQNTVQYAPIYANGTVGTWQTTTNFTNGRSGGGSFAYNNYLYVFGGFGSAYYSDTQYAKIDPAGMTQPWVTDSTHTLNTARSLTCAAITNGHIYAIGGSTTDATSSSIATTESAAINSDGTIGSWTVSTRTNNGNLATAKNSMSCTSYNGNLYAAGGYSSGTASANVYAQSVGSTGSLGSWSVETSFPSSAKPTGGGLFAYAGNLYSVGGANSSSTGTASTGVYYTPISTSTGSLGTWTATSSLSGNYVGRGYAIVGDHLYAVGGVGGDTAVEYATINSDGTVSSWASTGSLPSPGLENVSATTVNGCLYVIGGKNSSGTSQATTYFACPASDGTISSTSTSPNSWKTGLSLGTATSDVGLVSGNGYIYTVGGYTTAVINNVETATVNNGGNGATGTWTTNPNLLAVKNFAFGTVINNGYIYIIGGADQVSAYYNTVYYAKINADGTIGAFTSAGTGGTFTNGREYMGVAVYNGYIYMVGGYNGTTSYTDVQYSKINSDGTLGAWGSPGSGATYAATGVRGLSVEAYNGYLYELGGNDGTTRYNNVRYATINSDGTLSAWTTTTSFNSPRYLQKTVIYNGYIYVIGGYDTTNYYNDVQYAKLNSNGTVGSWVYTSAFVAARYSESAIVLNGYLYILGGYSGSEQADVQIAPIHADGSIGAWQTTNPFTTGRDAQGSVLWNGYLYVLGGSTGSSSTTNVQYAPVSSIARIAHYSKVIDMGSIVNVTSISYTGTLPNGNAAIGVRAAGATGIFGTSTIPIGTVSGSGGCTGNFTLTRYLFLTVNLDDSAGRATTGGGVFPDANSVNANLQDVTINSNPAHPPANIRLRTGQTLQSGILSPLDTCS